ncbi:MAG: hypothetical protein ACI92O_000417 [Colwellia sp.]|jgi:hypothetical protein
MIDFLVPAPKTIVELIRPAIIKRLTVEKRGQGDGKHYKPFLTVRDVPSKGRVHRRPALTHGRIVHLLSDLELSTFLLFDWDLSVTDIKEQFPLDPEKTAKISERLGIRHPAVSGVTQVMTTDFLLDTLQNNKVVQVAISVKYSNELEDARVIEKQELERRYWESLDIQWYLFTENEVPFILIQNIKWLIPHMHSYDLNKARQIEVFNTVNEAILTHPSDKIAVVMKYLDDQYKVDGGTYLSYLRHLLAQNAFTWDLMNIDHKSLNSLDLKASDFWIKKEYEYVHA